jgi:hypothetical protein
VVVLTREACAELVDEMRVRVWAEAEAARIVVLS